MDAVWTPEELEHMRRAIEIADGFHPHPNPRVGCVLVDPSGSVVGEGAHAAVGAAHAEQVALSMAGTRARSGTAYVTLEPCNHHGRTPPCTDALIAAGVSAVVAATLDPDPRVSGSGMEALDGAGIQVRLGLCDAEAIALDAGYHHHRRTGRPRVHVVLTSTVPGGLSQAANADLDRLRTRMDYVVGGTGDLLGHHATSSIDLADQLAALGDDGIVDLGIRDDRTVVEGLAGLGFVDVVTMYTVDGDTPWGPLGSGEDFVVTDVRTIGPETRIDAHKVA